MAWFGMTKSKDENQFISDCLVYLHVFSHVDPPIKRADPLLRQIIVLSYGHYTEEDLIEAGRRSSYGVLLDREETQVIF